MGRFYLLKNLIDVAIERGDSFVLFKRPGKKDPEFWLCESKEIDNSSLESLEKSQNSQFIFHSFSSPKAYILYCKKNTFGLKQLFPEVNFTNHNNSISFPIPNFDSLKDKKNYTTAFTHCIHLLDSKNLNKIVLSRKCSIEINSHSIDWAESFYDSIIKFPSTFSYLLYIPTEGFWMGATPELLLKSKQNKIEVMALAGTMPKGKSEEWSTKNKAEHQYVIDHIETSLNPYVCNLKKVGPISSSNGNINHLLTSFYATKKSDISISSILKSLHPTPAISGYPQSEAIKIIHEIEQYDRTFYSGFLGLYNQKGVELYVNLRVLSFHNNVLSFYAGGGIVIGSQLEDEWRETILKMNAISSCLKIIE